MSLSSKGAAGDRSPPSTVVSPRSARALLLLVIVLWGATWPVMKVGLDYIPPLTLVAARIVLAALTMFGASAAAGQLQWPSRHDWPIVAAIGLVQMCAFLTLVTLALQYVPAGRSAILAYSTSLWVLPLAAVFLGERASRAKLAGFVLGLAGIAVLFNPLGFDWSNRDVILGNGLLLLAALLWALLIVGIRGSRWQGSPLSLAPWQFLVAACVLVPIALVIERGEGIRWSRELAAILLYTGPVSTGFCFWAIITVNRALPALTTSLGTLGVPVVGLTIAAATLGETLSGTKVGGLLLIVAGLALVALADRRTGAR